MVQAVQSQLINITTGESLDLTGLSSVIGGRDAAAEMFLADTGCSRQQFKICAQADGFVLTNQSPHVMTYCDGEDVTAPVVLRPGMQITAGASKLLFQQTLPSRQVTHAETQLGSFDEYVAPVANSVMRSLADNESIVIGRAPTCDLSLPHIQVSWEHARVRRSGSLAYIEDHGSSNGTYVDGKRITLPQSLHPGSCSVIGPYTFYFTGCGITSQPRSNNLQLEAADLTVSVSNARAAGGNQVILDSVSVVIRPHQFVCLIGPSGSGKSTLLGALSARSPAQQGRVLLNQLDLYENFESLKRDIAVVQQRDILHEELRLEDALRFTAQLRLPTDTSRAEIESRITEILEQVGLTAQRQTQLARLSGGQRRRASLASELISNPSVLFLDEVTSGLDERTDREMMQLFRRLADSGKTVVCVTHTLANLEGTCHQVVVLGVGGKLVFCGAPDKAVKFFGRERLADIYECLESSASSADWQTKFRESEDYARNVSSLLSPQSSRLGSAKPVKRGIPWRVIWQTAGHQLPILLRRYFRVLFADRRSLCGILAQVAVVATVLWLVFGDLNDPTAQGPAQQVQIGMRASQVLFVLGISCFWFGCNNSVKEIVRERAIYTRELQVMLDPVSYYSSKLALQLAISGVQSVMLLGVVGELCSLPGDRGCQSAIVMLAAAAGVSVGLALSVAATTEAFALTLVPLVLIPQIILSDVFVKLTGFSEAFAGLFVANQWIYGMLRGSLPDALQQATHGLIAEPRSIFAGVSMVAAQISVLVLAAIGMLHIRDRVLAGSNKTLTLLVESWLRDRGLMGAAQAECFKAGDIVH